MQCEFQNTIGIIVPNLTVWGNSVKGAKARATGSHHELTDAPPRIRNTIWVLLGETLIQMTVTAQNNFRAGLVE
jgi:hypothetical protein